MTKEQEKKMTRLIKPLVEEIVKKQKLNEGTQAFNTLCDTLYDACEKANNSEVTAKEIIQALNDTIRELKGNLV